MFKILNADLYRPEKVHYLKSLEYAKNLSTDDSKKIIIHCFWRVPREFGRKQLAVIKSIITSHESNISNLELNLWSNIDLSTNIYLADVMDFINLKIWDMQSEIKGTILENCSFLNENDSVHDSSCYLEGDLFRLLILHKYGGFYVDMDVLILRDLSPINCYEFLYQWGTSGFNQHEPNLLMNGAIMRLDKNSTLSSEFLELINGTPPVKDSFIWGTNLYSRLKSDVWVLPGVWFNSEWGFEDTHFGPFIKIENYSLFDGAFAWHWHNRWDEEIQDGSKFHILESIINKRFELFKIQK